VVNGAVITKLIKESVMPTNIIVKFDLEGVHAWPDAPEVYTLLRARHAHIFNFDIRIPVTGSRQLEFLDVRRTLKQTVEKSYGKEPCDFRSMSCEQLIDSVVRMVKNIYGIAPDYVSVCEDRFVGAERFAEFKSN
jgi:hypothetical protein